MGTFSPDKTIFSNEDVLRENYTPDELLERDDERKKYKEGLKPVINGSTPNNLLVYGQTGVGKTLASRIMLDDLEESAQDVDGVSVRHVWVNCQVSSSYQVAINIVNSFRDSSNQISKTGHAKDSVYEMMWDEINDADETHVLIVLDEIDEMGTDADLLYDIPRAKDNNKAVDSEVGFIGISNDFTFKDNLPARVQSSLCQMDIHFRAYTPQELEPILKQRSEEAFYSDALDEGVVPLVAALAGNDTGSARHAINILHKAGSLARMNDEDSVKAEHAYKAQDLVEKGRIVDELRSLPTQSHLVLLSLLNLEQRGKTPARKKDVYQMYSAVAEDTGNGKKTSRTVHNRLSDLALSGFLTLSEVNKGKSGGMYHLYELDMPLDIVKKAIEEETDLINDGDSQNAELNEFAD